MEEAKEMARVLASYVNTCDLEAGEKLAEQLLRVHPTLQQNVTRFCVAWFRKLAGSRMFDDRNKASVMLARRIKPELDEAFLPYI